MLTVEQVEKSFRGTPVLRGVSLEVARGDVVAILGPSGAGKTTLLRCLALLERAEGGTLRLGDTLCHLPTASGREAVALRRRMGFVFQSYDLFRNKTALQNVTLGLTVARRMPRAQAEEIGLAMLDKVGLLDRRDAYPSQLSGGQQQRVAIAPQPEILYFDEPTSALDPELTGEVLGVMRRLAEEGRTMLVVTHELGFARNVANRVVFMEEGRVVEEAPAQTFFSHPREERSRAFLQQTLEEQGKES